MIIKESSLKLDEPFNSCPGGKVFKEILDENILEGNYKFVDLDKKEMPYYQNDLDTVVIMLTNKSVEIGLASAVVTLNSTADEFMWFRTADKNYILRFWWD